MPLLLMMGVQIILLSFSAPKGVERACPGSRREQGVANMQSFSAPKGVERACPRVRPRAGAYALHVSVPRRALRGHAQKLLPNASSG